MTITKTDAQVIQAIKALEKFCTGRWYWRGEQTPSRHTFTIWKSAVDKWRVPTRGPFVGESKKGIAEAINNAMLAVQRNKIDGPFTDEDAAAVKGI